MYHVEPRVGGAEKSRSINQAQALEYFEQFINATSLKNILGYFRTMCEILHLKPTYYPLFYPKLKAMLNSWKAKAIWKKLDSRSNHKCYGKAKIGEKTRVLIIGGGPCGLRSAIEAQLLGCKVVVVEKRDRLSRNNVLHLWPFVIEDLRALGAKKFFGKFCAGSIDHISIRQLQCILLKVALILGVEIHTEVSFENIIEPNHDEKIGWRAQLKPQNHPVSQYEFDVIIGADGKRNTLAGFKRKEFRGKLAIAITANFINKRTEAEARVEEISGVAFIFNQKFFKDLYQDTGIDLENIVYYKDDTHYFVMTAKKPSLIEKGVILQDLADTERLLGADNVNREALLNYAKEAAEFSTNYQMPQLEFAVNHYGQPDVAMFDFTSMFAAENASKVLERSGYQLLMILVGDSLLEPFWPTGSGCARGFLSSLDAAWAIRSWSLAKASPLEVLAERESIYRLLAQTTPDNLNKDWKSYTLDPSTRYPNFNRSTVSPHQIVSLYDTDDIQNIEKMGRNLENTSNISRKRRRDMVDSEILIDWVKQQVKKHSDLEITDLTSIFRSGKVLCAIIHHYRPDLIDYSSLTNNEPSVNNQLAIDILEKDIGIPPIMTGAEITETSDNLALAAYLTQVYDVFRTEIPHVKHPKLKDIYPGFDSNSHSISQSLELFPNRAHIYIEKIEPLQETTKERSSSSSEFSILCEQKSYNSSSESLFILYPFFPSAKPSECSLETVKRHEYDIKANNKIVSLLYGNKELIDSQRLAVENVNSEVNSTNVVETHSGMVNLPDIPQEIPIKLNENLLANCSEKYLKLRSKLVKKQYLLKKNSTLSFQQKFEIQEININSSATSLKNCLSNTSLWIKILEHDEHYQERSVRMQPSRNTLTLIANTFSSNLTKKKVISDRYVKSKCRFSKNIQINFSSNANMYDAEENESIGPEQVFSRVSYWIESNDFYEDDSQCTDIFDINTEPIETNIEEGFSDITSITKCLERKTMGRTKKLVVRELSENNNSPRVTGKDDLPTQLKSVNENKMMKPLGKFSTYPVEEKPECPVPFSVITEGQESELPESKYTTTSFKTIIKEPSAMIASNINSRPSSKHKRHVEGILATKSANIERKTRKRKTFDKAGSVDYDNKPPSLVRGNTDEDFVAKIKSIEQGWQGTQVAEKKPKDLLRKIGKIETSDWNIKEIEKKIKENKMGKPILRDKEKVPKWSREQFVARQTKMEKLDRQDSSEAKYADIDKNIKYLDMKLKEGTNRDLGQNKVATITEKLAKKIPEPSDPIVAKSTDKPVILPSYSGSEFCHFCSKRVYLMERLSAEGRFFHHGCFKCQYCKAQLRLGSYAFDKDGIYGHKFFCLHHYGMQGETRSATKVSRKPSQRGVKPAAKKILSGVSGVDLLDRVRTPERVEFSNLSRCSSDQEDSLSQMDEDEWTDRNFGASTAEVGSSDDEDSSSYSETDSDDEEAYEEALEEPATKEGTMKWAERMSKRHFSKQYKSDSDPYGSSDSSSYYENSSDDDDSNTATEGEEEIRARELRLQEVRLEPPIIQADTGTDTEVISDDNSSDISSEVQNSATEISTDSEFAQDDPTPTSEIPAIILNDLYVNMSRGSSSNRPKKIQVTSGFIQKPNGKAPKQDIELNLTPLVSPAPSLRKITPSIKPPTEAYALNRTQSTGGIASKVSLELKKRYLLGESIGSGSIQKSGSASTLDTKLKSFCSNISDCQKLLKPASEISASMQTFCNKLDEHTSPVLSPLSVNKQLPIESKENNEDVKIEVLPPPDLINVTLAEKNEETVKETFENETEGRPRSPLHETSLIVPEIDWKKIGHSVENTSSSSSSSSSSDEQGNTPNLSHNKIPTVEIHNADDPPDDIKKLWDNHSIASDSVKSIASDKKQLNQPKTLPGLINDIPVGTIKKKSKESTYKKISPQDDRSSECSTPISGGEEITAAFTETELSDWARDGGVSDDLEGMAFDLNIENDVQQKIPELCILNHVCGKTDQEKQVNNEQQSANFDSIEFMDTCTESNSEEGIVDSIGYNLFKNEDITEDSLNPSINENMEEKNTCMDDSKIKNSGYCVLASESSNFGGEVINLKPSDIEQLKHNQNLTEREEDSLVVIETTTEENTCSDSTVKNITEIPIDANKMYETNSQKQRLEEKLVQLKKEKKETILKAQIQRECDKEKGDLDCNNIAEMKNVEFEEHCQRLQSKVDFGNVKDSIDIRKSRRKSRDSPQKQDFIQEEKQYFGSSNSLKEITLNLTPTIKTPEQIYKKEVIEKERDINQKLIQEMVMSKMRAENKALERRVRTRPTNNLNRGFQLSKSATTDMANVNNMSNLENQGASNILKQTSCNFVLKEKEPIIELNALQKSRTSPNIPEDNIRKVVCDLHVPVAPPRSRDLKSSTEKLRNDARVRAKMLSNDELGLSPEDKLQKFREKSKMYDRSISKENSEFQLFPMSLNTQVIPRRKVLQRPLSEYSPKISENRKSFNTVCDDNKQLKMCHSESNLLDMKNGKGKGKEVSPKKGIKFIKIMDLFSKKSPKGLFSKISAKSKDTSKSCPSLLEWTHVFTEKPPTNKHARVKSFPEALSQINSTEVPPPVPPLPLCYTEQLLRNPEESSEDELKKNKHTPCETGDASGIFDDSLSSLTERHPHKRNRRSIREAQLKRHRMAQEIQRKLEETEVKTKELEEKGVLIEKNLRGELSQGSSKLESDLLQEWFDIMRDRTELRRYEKELIIRAQELELEDRHARLQHQLRKRLSEENKTEEDKEADCRIINEMLEIVSKRDSLTALLEEDRLRYLSEDRDFEEQMLSKDLYLTPNGKSMKNN